MARMIPADVEQFTTEGEGVFYKFLEYVCKPDQDYIVWYSPDILNREPDFVLFRRDLGILIIEVKDWSLDQIEDLESVRKQIHGSSSVGYFELEDAGKFWH